VSTPGPQLVVPAKPFSAWERSIALRYLRARRKEGGVALVSIISFVGVMLAVMALIIIMSVMNGFRSELMGKILGFNAHLYVAGEPINASNRAAAIARIKALPGVVEAAPTVEAQAMLLGRGQISGAIVRGVTPADLARTPIIANNIRKGGSLADFGEGEYGGDRILVGERLASQLDLDVGDTVTLVSPTGGDTPFGSTPRSKDYVIGGIFSVGMSEYDQAFAYMPLEQAQLFFGRDDAVDAIAVKLANADRARDLRGKVAKAAGPGAIVTDWTDRNQSFFNALQVERSVMRLILLFVVAIAAMNIITGLIMLVKNKTKDIAILRTMGAGRGAVLRIFFMAGAAIGVLGTFAGLVAGVLFCVFIKQIQAFVEWVTQTSVFNADVYFLSHIPAKVDWVEVAIITVWAVLMSFIATLPPSWRASRLDPVEALRYE
jgi:lipoprotein-releasing system permease protein